MIGDEEEGYFPRGGTTKNAVKKRSFVFGPKKPNKELMKKPGKRERTKTRQLKRNGRPVNDDNDDDDNGDEDFNKIAKLDGEDVSAERRCRIKKVQMLSYQNMVEGMVILCTTSGAPLPNKNRVQVCLPERLLCSVDIDDVIVKKSFGTSLEDSSEKCQKRPPKPGTFLVCKIKSSARKNGAHEVVGSTNPAHVYSSLSFSDVHVGSVFLGAVKNAEDYGFLVYLGVNGLTAFLPYENCADPVNAKNQFLPGKLIWCVVVSSKLGETTNTVKLSMKPEDFEAHRISDSVLTPQSVLPGMELDLTVTKHLGGDLEVSVDGTQVIGFVPRSHFPTLADDATKFRIGTKLKGTVLYKYPVSNIVAFSLRVNLLCVPKGTVKSGAVIRQAEIVSHGKRGLGVKFEHKKETCYGVVSRRKMEGTIELDKMEEMFPKGNHLSVVVVGYHHIDQLYSCSTHNDLLSGKVLVADKKKELVGKSVSVVIKKKTESGIIVSWDSMNGYVPLSHISDVVGAKNILKSLQINSTHKGRILQFDPQKKSLIVTLRPTLVNSTPLVDFDKALKGDEYWGVVNSVNDSSINVIFFNNLKTNIDNENLVQDSRKYRIGELVKCFVVKNRHKAKPPVFSLVRPIDQMLLSVGATYKLIVKAKDENGINCLLEERNNVMNVSIPLKHLSDFESFREKALETLTPGATVDAVLFCFDSNLHPVFSLRASVKHHFEAGGATLSQKGYAAFKHGDLMPVIISEEVEEGYYVSVPVPVFNKKLLVTKKTVKRCGNFSVGDVIWLAVNAVRQETQDFELIYPDPKTFGKQVLEWAVSNLVNYFDESASYHNYKMGQKISAVGCGVKNQCKLADGRIGLIVTGLRDKPVTHPEGQAIDMLLLQPVPGRDDCFHVLKPTKCKTISEGNLSDANAESHKTFSVVFSSEMFYVGRSDVTGTYCVCPRFLQPNSLHPDLHAEVINGDEIIKVQEFHPYLGGLTIGCPSLGISGRKNVSQANALKKKRTYGKAFDNEGSENVKTTFVMSSSPVSEMKTSKVGIKKKGIMTKQPFGKSSPLVSNPLLNISEY